MRKNLFIVFVLITVLNACGQKQKSAPDYEKKKAVTPNIQDSTTIQKNVNDFNAKFIDTKHVYVDSEGNHITIVNSLPKGGLKYSDPMGREYVYAVFWTRITNETKTPFEMTMDSFEGSYQLPSSPDRFFKLFFPSDTLSIDKVKLFNYGFDLEEYLDHNFQKQSDFRKTILPNSVSGFYVIILFNKSVVGTMRTELRLQGQKILYRVNDKEIECGNINLQLLEVKK